MKNQGALRRPIGGFVRSLGNGSPNVRRENRGRLGLVPARDDDAEGLGLSDFLTILLHCALSLIVATSWLGPSLKQPLCRVGRQQSSHCGPMTCIIGSLLLRGRVSQNDTRPEDTRVFTTRRSAGDLLGQKAVGRGRVRLDRD